jgi:hypothetical protein
MSTSSPHWHLHPVSVSSSSKNNPNRSLVSEVMVRLRRAPYRCMSRWSVVSSGPMLDNHGVGYLCSGQGVNRQRCVEAMQTFVCSSTLGSAPGATRRAWAVHASLCHRVQAVTLNLRGKLLEDTLAQRVPELWGNKVWQLDVRIGLVSALWQHIVIQRGALLTL